MGQGQGEIPEKRRPLRRHRPGRNADVEKHRCSGMNKYWSWEAVLRKAPRQEGGTQTWKRQSPDSCEEPRIPQTRDKAGRHNEQNYRDEGLLLSPKGKTSRGTEAEPRDTGEAEGTVAGKGGVEKGGTGSLYPDSLLLGL